jgi:hypothetical protein
MSTHTLRTAALGFFGALMIGAAPIASAHAGEQDFDLVNDSGRTIERIFVSSVNTRSWENDVLGRFVLPSGYVKHVRFSDDYPGCRFDVKVVFADGRSLIRYGVNLCRVGEVTVT